MTGVQAGRPRTRASLLRSFLGFGGLSGLGWLLDFSLLLLLTGALGAPGFVANLVSSLVASATVFLVSRRLVFASAEGRVTFRLAAYLLYTLAVILVASVALQWIAGLIGHEAARRAIPLSPTWVVASAKIIITPPQLALNFLISRYLNERVMNG